MKVEANLTLIKGEETAGTGPRKTSRTAREVTSPGFGLLISQENQKARRLDPSSLKEARVLLREVALRLANSPGETLAEIHKLQPPFLIRLPKPE